MKTIAYSRHDPTDDDAEKLETVAREEFRESGIEFEAFQWADDWWGRAKNPRSVDCSGWLDWPAYRWIWYLWTKVYLRYETTQAR